MGEVADMMTEGVLCSGCGVFLDDEAEGYAGADGHPRYCRRCGGRPEHNGRRGPEPAPAPVRTRLEKEGKP